MHLGLWKLELNLAECCLLTFSTQDQSVRTINVDFDTTPSWFPTPMLPEVDAALTILSI